MTPVFLFYKTFGNGAIDNNKGEPVSYKLQSREQKFIYSYNKSLGKTSRESRERESLFKFRSTTRVSEQG